MVKLNLAALNYAHEFQEEDWYCCLVLDYENQMGYGILYNISEKQYKFTCSKMQSIWYYFQIYGIKYIYMYVYITIYIHRSPYVYTNPFLHPIYLFLDHKHSNCLTDYNRDFLHIICRNSSFSLSQANIFTQCTFIKMHSMIYTTFVVHHEIHCAWGIWKDVLTSGWKLTAPWLRSEWLTMILCIEEHSQSQQTYNNISLVGIAGLLANVLLFF